MNKILISILTGIGIGILIAPAKGSDTRRKITERFKAFTEDIEEQADEIYDNGKGLIKHVKTEVNDLVADVKSISKEV